MLTCAITGERRPSILWKRNHQNLNSLNLEDINVRVASNSFFCKNSFAHGILKKTVYLCYFLYFNAEFMWVCNMEMHKSFTSRKKSCVVRATKKKKESWEFCLYNCVAEGSNFLQSVALLKALKALPAVEATDAAQCLCDLSQREKQDEQVTC